MASPGKSLNTAVRSAKQEITETGKFLKWLYAEHGLAMQGLRQAHLNQYLGEGPTTRYAIRTFLVWQIKNKEIGRLEIPHRYAATKPLITQQQRLDLIRQCIESTGAPLSFRVAGLILLLFGQPVGKIAALQCVDLQALPEGLHLSLGNIPVLVPAQIAPMFWDHYTTGPTNRLATRGAGGSSPGPCPANTSTPTP